MSKSCSNCGKKIGYLESPLLLDSDIIICEKCKKIINANINKLSEIVSLDNDDSEICLNNKLINLKENDFSDEVIRAIKEYCLELIQKERNRIEINANMKADIEIESNKITLKEIQNHLLTTGYNFEGYKITVYNGVLSGQTVLGTGFLSEFTASFADFFGEQSNAFANKLELAKNAAVEKLIKKSIIKGGNALIGIDIDYIIFSSNMIGVIANGTSVIIEKNEQ